VGGVILEGVDVAEAELGGIEGLQFGGVRPEVEGPLGVEFEELGQECAGDAEAAVVGMNDDICQPRAVRDDLVEWGAEIVVDDVGKCDGGSAVVNDAVREGGRRRDVKAGEVRHEVARGVDVEIGCVRVLEFIPEQVGDLRRIVRMRRQRINIKRHENPLRKGLKIEKT